MTLLIFYRRNSTSKGIWVIVNDFKRLQNHTFLRINNEHKAKSRPNINAHRKIIMFVHEVSCKKGSSLGENRLSTYPRKYDTYALRKVKELYTYTSKRKLYTCINSWYDVIMEELLLQLSFRFLIELA